MLLYGPHQKHYTKINVQIQLKFRTANAIWIKMKNHAFVSLCYGAN